MMVRIWHGYTTETNADVYENLLKEEIFLEIERKNIAGFKGIELLRRGWKQRLNLPPSCGLTVSNP